MNKPVVKLNGPVGQIVSTLLENVTVEDFPTDAIFIAIDKAKSLTGVLASRLCKSVDDQNLAYLLEDQIAVLEQLLNVANNAYSKLEDRVGGAK